LIEGTVIKIKSGHEMVQKTNEEFKTVALTSRRVVYLNGEIAGASQEHFQGIRQNQVFPL
ncbi:MAG: hypothetical protein Q7J12_01075, partial [Syntrophales bacterium]|nr:hypothetical protein [Syntrophales bacterium]